MKWNQIAPISVCRLYNEFQKFGNNNLAPSLQAYTGNIIWQMSYAHKDELDDKQTIITSHYMKWKEAINAALKS